MADADPGPGAHSPGDPPVPQRGEEFRILFVCTGNTCRSPMAEVLARRALARRGWNRVAVRSAGVAAGPGGPASDGALHAVRAVGLELDDHRSTPLSAGLVEWADLILAMSPAHLHRVMALGGGEKGAVLTAFIGADLRGVPDPFGGDPAIYEETLHLLDELVEATLHRLEPILAP